MSRVEIIPVEYAKSFLAESYIFQGGSADKMYPIVFKIYLIKTENRLILADAGCETMPGFDMRDFIGPVKALEKLGVKTDDITDVVITHAHHDHIECVSEFKKAMVYIQSDEYENGKQYFDNDTNVKLFDDEVQICPAVKAIKIGGHSIGSCVVEVADGKEKWLITGDECYVRECLERKIATGASVCPEKSRGFIDKYADSEYNILLCHSN